MYTLTKSNNSIATLSTVSECNKVLKALNLQVVSYTVTPDSDDVIVNVTDREQTRKNTAYLAYLDSTHAEAMKPSPEYTARKGNDNVALQPTADKTLLLDGVKGISRVYRRYGDGKVDDKVTKGIDFMKVLNVACYKADRTKRIVIYAFPQGCEKNKAYNYLRHALERGQEVYLPDIETNHIIRVDMTYINTLSSRWALHFEDEAHRGELYGSYRTKRGTVIHTGLLRNANLVKQYLADPVATIEFCTQYVLNSGYDCGFTSTIQYSKKSNAVWDAKDGIQGNAWVDDRGLTHFTSTDDTRMKDRKVISDEDIVRAYVQVKAYEKYGIEPERKVEQAKRDEFFQDMYGMSEEEYQQSCYAVKGYCTITTECDKNPEWLS